MRQLVLLRHATAEDAVGRDDFGRQLTARGRADAARMGRWLAHDGLVPDLVLASAAPRAAQTARLACEALGVPAASVHEEERLYGVGPAALLQRLAAVPASARRVLVVAHNPTLEQVAVHLTGDEDLQRRGLAKGAAVVADLPDDWGDLGAKCARRWVVADPADLP